MAYSLVYLTILSAQFARAAVMDSPGLSPDFYSQTCPGAIAAVKAAVESAVRKEPRMGASLLRLSFHDCFVNGCDASVLLDESPNFTSEKNASGNLNSLRGFEVIDEIKAAVDKACGKPIVSCADIIALAARDSVVALGGPSWQVQLGRRDAWSANRSDAERYLPGPLIDLTRLVARFQEKGLDLKDLVVLSASHTIGQAQCRFFRTRIYNDYNIDNNFAHGLQDICPPSGGDDNLAPIDYMSPNQFGFNYFLVLMNKRALFHSDQELFNGGAADNFTKYYALNPQSFFQDYAASIVKMQSLGVLTGNQGEVRANCRKINA